MTIEHEPDRMTGTRIPSTGAEAFQIAESAGSSLQERLDIYSSFSRMLYPAINSQYDKLIDRLAFLKGAGPAIGGKLPDFMLPDVNGRLTCLDDYLGKGPLVISFNRGHWCPWCRLEVKALASIYPGIRAAGADAVSIVPETAAYARRLTEAALLPFPVLTDLDLGYTLSIGLAIWAGAELRDSYKALGLELALFHGNEGCLLPVPATFVLGGDGRIKARFMDPDFRKRMDPQDILKALAG